MSSPHTRWPPHSQQAAVHHSSRPAPSLRPLKHTCSRDPWLNQFPEILLFSWQPRAEWVSCCSPRQSSFCLISVLVPSQISALTVSQQRTGKDPELFCSQCHSQHMASTYFNCLAGISYTWARSSVAKLKVHNDNPLFRLFLVNTSQCLLKWIVNIQYLR